MEVDSVVRQVAADHGNVALLIRGFLDGGGEAAVNLLQVLRAVVQVREVGDTDGGHSDYPLCTCIPGLK